MADYENFQIHITQQGDKYFARVTNHGRVPHADGTLDLPEGLEALQGVKVELAREFPSRDAHALAAMPKAEIGIAPKEFGERLARALFRYQPEQPGRLSVRDSYNQARGAGQKLRVRLVVEAAPASLPWEFLRDLEQPTETYFARSPETLLSRMTRVEYVDLSPIAPPFRVLAIAALPSGATRLDLEAEKKAMNDAFAPLEAKGLAKLDWWDPRDSDGLQTRLQSGRYHAFHFAGHGDFDAATGRGTISLCDANGGPRPLDAQSLTDLFRDSGVRLIFLNCCKGATSVASDAFASIAEQLAGVNVPAVLAMQYAVSDNAANDFAKKFYEDLAGGAAIDEAVTQARIQIKRNFAGHEWATPVLYLNARDGRLLELAPPAVTPDASSIPETWGYLQYAGVVLLSAISFFMLCLSLIDILQLFHWRSVVESLATMLIVAGGTTLHFGHMLIPRRAWREMAKGGISRAIPFWKLFVVLTVAVVACAALESEPTGACVTSAIVLVVIYAVHAVVLRLFGLTERSVMSTAPARR